MFATRLHAVCDNFVKKDNYSFLLAFQSMNFNLSKYLLLPALNVLFLLGGCAHSSENHSGHDHNEDNEHHDHSEIEDHHDHIEEEAHHDHSGVMIQTGQAKKYGIETDTIMPASFREAIKTSGYIQPSPSDVYTVSARKSGIVSFLPGVSEGSYVKAGSSIGSISSDGLQGGDPAQAAEANLKSAKAEYERLKPLYEEKLVTASTFKEAERAYNEAKAIAGTRSTAGVIPLSATQEGVISNLFVTSGQFVEAGAPVARINKNSIYTLTAELPARYSGQIPSIATASFIPDGRDEIVSLENLDGKKISNAVETASGGYIPVRFSFSGNPSQHPAGYAEIFLLGKEREGVISVPRGALLELQGNKYVYVVHHGSEYEKRLVKTGASNGDRIEIIEGITPGECIVTKGASVVRMAETSAVAPPSHTHNH